MIGAPDATSAVLLPGLLARLAKLAPGIDLSVRPILPSQHAAAGVDPWAQAFAEIEARALDIAIVPRAGRLDDAHNVAVVA